MSDLRVLARLFTARFTSDDLLRRLFGVGKDNPTAAAALYLRLDPHARPDVSYYFDRAFYIASNRDIYDSGLEPYVHFMTFGIYEGRSPHWLIDLRYISTVNPDLLVQSDPANRLAYALDSDEVVPSPYFDRLAYLAWAQDGGDAEVPASVFQDYLRRSPRGTANRYFDPDFYLARYGELPGVRANPFRHFVIEGDHRLLRPSNKFDSEWYYNVNADVRHKGFAPLRHFLEHGRFEGRPSRPHNDVVADVPQDRHSTSSASALPVGYDGPPRLAVDADTISIRTAELRDALRQRSRPTQSAEPIAGMVEYLDPRQLLALSVPRTDAPEVSIIVPAYNQFKMTAECIISIAKNTAGIDYEIILADDRSTDPQFSLFDSIPNLVHLKTPENVGFLQNCNFAYGRARAPLVLLLNNDAQLTDGALGEMLRTLKERPTLGAVGAKLVYPSGHLQEAGCAVLADGATEMMGWGRPPDDPEFSSFRCVDYASGAALLFKRHLVGDGPLFDRLFSPAYCEDVDLCLRIASTGHEIGYCPRALVVHHMSVSTSVDSNDKRVRLATTNQQKLYEKWSQAIEDLNQIRILSFYLPQFHAIKENDLWWGRGFTEWHKVTSARPSYLGHYQPRLPADLGYYDLRRPEVMADQAELAMQYGVHGFMVYYYNFGGRRMLGGPLDDLLERPDTPFRFALCWANESWSRNWDGGNREVLLADDYSTPTLQSVAADFIRMARDERYISVNGRPLFAMYRPLLCPNVLAFTDMLRRSIRSAGFPDAYLCYVESMETVTAEIEPSILGFDAAIEFPPQGIAIRSLESVEILKEGYEGLRYDYEATVVNACGRPPIAYKRMPGAFPSWDNTARQPLRGTSFDGEHPALFQVYLEQKIREARFKLRGEERMVFINAWNEWAEGAHLEPDVRGGHENLVAVRNALMATGQRAFQG